MKRLGEGFKSCRYGTPDSEPLGGTGGKVVIQVSVHMVAMLRCLRLSRPSPGGARLGLSVCLSVFLSFFYYNFKKLVGGLVQW